MHHGGGQVIDRQPLLGEGSLVGLLVEAVPEVHVAGVLELVGPDLCVLAGDGLLLLELDHLADLVALLDPGLIVRVESHAGLDVGLGLAHPLEVLFVLD
jgi:hypothetical protein